MQPPRTAFDYPISQGFGPTKEQLDGPYNGYRNFNKGYDYAAPLGTPVPARQGGTVIAAGASDDGWGISVKVRDPNGFVHNYGHLNNVNVRVGDNIERGQLVGASGNTGRSTGPHLSYDVRRADTNEYVDPQPWVGGGGQVNQYPQSGGPQSGPQQGGGDEIAALIATARARIQSATDPYGRQDAIAELVDLVKVYQLLNPNTPIEIALKQYELNEKARQNQQEVLQGGYNADVGRFGARNTIANQNYTNQRQEQEDAFAGPIAAAAMERNRARDQADINDAAYANNLNYYDRVVGADDRKLNQAVQDVGRSLKGKDEARQRADQIDKTLMDAAKWALPPGTEYWPGFEPTGLLAQVSQKGGLTWDPNLGRVPEGATNATAGIMINPGARLAEQDVAMGVAGGLPTLPPFMEREAPTPPPMPNLPDQQMLIDSLKNRQAIPRPELSMDDYPAYPSMPQMATPPDVASIVASMNQSSFGRNAPQPGRFFDTVPEDVSRAGQSISTPTAPQNPLATQASMLTRQAMSYLPRGSNLPPGTSITLPQSLSPQQILEEIWKRTIGYRQGR